MDIEVESQRHPLRFMVKFLVFVGILVLAGKFMAKQKEDWAGITEAQAMEKIESRLVSRVGEDKANDIASQIVAVLTEKGVIKAEAADEEVVDVTGEADEGDSDEEEAVAEDVEEVTTS